MNLAVPSLRSFAAVIEAQGYTPAAKKLFLSQPGVYQHVRQLEMQLGTKLVEQRGKRVVPTEHGRALYELAQRWRDNEEDLLGFLHDDATLQRGDVSIAAGTTAAEFLLPRATVAFRRRYPGISVSITVGSTPQALDASVLERRADFGVHSEPVRFSGVTKRAFLSDELMAIVPPNHRLARRTRGITPQDLAREEIIMFGPRQPAAGGPPIIQRLADEWFRLADVQPRVQLRIGTLEGMKNAVRDGAGVAIVSSYSIRPGDASLKSVRLAQAPSRDFVSVTREGGWESNVARALREFIEGLSWLDWDPRDHPDAGLRLSPSKLRRGKS